MSDRTSAAISAGMSARIANINETDFEAKAKKILAQEPLLSARDVEVTFSLRGKKLTAIRRTSLDLYEGETLAIVGESGSGKSVFTKCFVGMLDKNGSITNGSIMYDGQDLTQLKEKDWLQVRGKKIAMVTQDPMTSLNPLKTIGPPGRRPTGFCGRLASRNRSADTSSIPMSFPAACGSAWSSPSRLPAGPRS